MASEAPSWVTENTNSSSSSSQTPSPTTTITPAISSSSSSSKKKKNKVKKNAAPQTLPTFSPPASFSDVKSPDQDPIPAEGPEVLTKYIILLRLMNMATMGLVGTAAVITLVSWPSITTVIYAVYAFFFACLVFCFETQLKMIRTAIAVNFGFFYSPIPRFLFDAMLCSMVWELGVLGLIAGIILVCLGTFNLYVLCKYGHVYKATRAKLNEVSERSF